MSVIARIQFAQFARFVGSDDQARLDDAGGRVSKNLLPRSPLAMLKVDFMSAKRELATIERFAADFRVR